MSSSINASALRPGDAIITLRVKANYGSAYPSNEYTTVAKVTVIDPLLTPIPTYVTHSYHTTPLLLIPPDAEYNIRTRRDHSKVTL